MTSKASADESSETTPLLSGMSHAATSVAQKTKDAAKGLTSGASHSLSKVGFKAGEKMGTHYGKACTGYDKLFFKHVNRTFGDNLEVASRGACFIVLLALPFVLPSEICPRCKQIVDAKLYTSSSITYFIYTLYLYTGDTLHFARAGIAGTILAVFNCWVMQGVMPGGYMPVPGEFPHRWYAGCVWGIVFVFTILWLNFDGNTRIFALSTFVYYWMAFLNPEETAGFAQGFEIKLNGQASSELSVAVAGCLLAVVAGYLPYPMYAHSKSLDVANNLIQQMYMAKSDFVTYYVGNKSDPMVVNILTRELATLRSEAGKLTGLLDSAWYEGMGSATKRRQRVMLSKFQIYVDSSSDDLSMVFNICRDETFDEKHVGLMNQVKDPLDAILHTNAEILKICIAGLTEGSFSDELVGLIEEQKKISESAVQDLTQTFQKARTELGMNSVSGDIAGENTVATAFCRWSETTAKFSDSLQGDQASGQSSSWMAGMLGVFNPNVLFEKDHVMWTLRNGLSIVLAFFVGWHGYNRYITPYNATIGSTVCVLLSNFVGSAMTKNLSRLQGVVIGVVLGNLLYALLGWCYWWAHILVAVALYLWALMGLFMYYHSASYGTVGLLLVVFGCQQLLRPCANSDTDPSGHALIVDVTVGIVIMTVVDILLSPARASAMAQKAFHDAYEPMIGAVSDLFDHDKEMVEDRKGKLGSCIQAAQNMGNEAAMEPRYWRLDWPTSSFNQAVECLGSLRFFLKSIEHNVTDGKGQKASAFLRALQLNSFSDEGGVKDLLIKHMTAVMGAIETSLDDHANHDVFMVRMGELDILAAGRKTAALWPKAVQKLVDELNTNVTDWSVARNSMTEDGRSGISVFVESLKAMFSELDAVLLSISA